jgi:preprotein translocase subunit SecF
VFNIIGRRHFYFVLSALILVPGTIALLIWGLRLGIDFTGGSLLEVRVGPGADITQVRQVVVQQGIADPEVVTTSDTAGNVTYLIRTETIETPKKNEILQALRTQFGDVTENSFETVGPVVGAETTRRAFIAVAATSGVILLYLSYAFRQVPSPWRFGTVAVLAILHDALLVLGLWAIFGRLFALEVDSLFVTGILTVIGFSVHDTIVVFDRVRENVGRFPGESFERVVNFSINQTLDRSLMTGLCAIFTLVALLLLGGETIRNFVLVLTIGIVSGTYSSIFFASCLLVVWENDDIGRFWRRLTGRDRAAPEPAAA